MLHSVFSTLQASCCLFAASFHSACLPKYSGTLAQSTKTVQIRTLKEKTPFQNSSLKISTKTLKFKRASGTRSTVASSLKIKSTL
jgi:hypothetical protein